MHAHTYYRSLACFKVNIGCGYFSLETILGTENMADVWTRFLATSSPYLVFIFRLTNGGLKLCSERSTRVPIKKGSSSVHLFLLLWQHSSNLSKRSDEPHQWSNVDLGNSLQCLQDVFVQFQNHQITVEDKTETGGKVRLYCYEETYFKSYGSN